MLWPLSLLCDANLSPVDLSGVGVRVTNREAGLGANVLPHFEITHFESGIVASVDKLKQEGSDR